MFNYLMSILMNTYPQSCFESREYRERALYACVGELADTNEKLYEIATYYGDRVEEISEAYSLATGYLMQVTAGYDVLAERNDVLTDIKGKLCEMVTDYCNKDTDLAEAYELTIGYLQQVTNEYEALVVRINELADANKTLYELAKIG